MYDESVLLMIAFQEENIVIELLASITKTELQINNDTKIKNNKVTCQKK